MAFDSDRWEYGQTLRPLSGRSLDRLPALQPRDRATRPQVIRGALDAQALERLLRESRKLAVDRQSGIYDDESRRAESRWILPTPEWEWLYGAVEGLFESANQSFGFQVDRFVDPLLVAEYPQGPGFDWHLDTLDGVTATRKISLTIALSPPGGYAGGDLEIAPFGMDAGAREEGCAVLFPSFLCHRVTPITRGRRTALVGWLHGPGFA